jgi:F-type H+-transporting ATPase subunit b
VPQLAQHATYLSQVFWLVVIFTILLIVMWRVALPRVAAILRDRQERIDRDVEEAGRYKADAEAALAAYEKAMAEGRAKAQELLREAAERVAREAAEAQAAAGARLQRETAEAEGRIAEAKRQALAGVREVAAEAARAATVKFIGAEASTAEAEEAAGRLLAGRRS